MGNVVEKMSNKVAGTLLGNDIFLPAILTISAGYNRPAIQAILFFSCSLVRQLINSLNMKLEVKIKAITLKIILIN